MKFAKIASPDISGVDGPRHVAKNFGNTFCHKFRQHFQKLNFFQDFQPKSTFSISQFGKEGGAPGQKFLFDVISID